MDSADTDNSCSSIGERICNDGSCISEVDLCPEEQKNENTVLITALVVVAFIISLVIFYCWQSRRNVRPNGTDNVDSALEQADNASLNMPPPTYEEVITTNLYPPTPVLRRNTSISSEEPRTPPPNYDAALHILAQSHDCVFSPKPTTGPVLRTSVSSDNNLDRMSRPSRTSESVENGQRHSSTDT